MIFGLVISSFLCHGKIELVALRPYVDKQILHQYNEANTERRLVLWALIVYDVDQNMKGTSFLYKGKGIRISFGGGGGSPEQNPGAKRVNRARLERTAF